MYADSIIEDLISEAKKTPINQKFSDDIERLLTISPEIVIELLNYYGELPEKSRKKVVVLKLISRCLDQLRYNLDRKSPEAARLFTQVQGLLLELYKRAKSTTLPSLNALLYDSQLPFSIELAEDAFTSSEEIRPDIVPRLPELLEQIRRQHRIRSSFDLFEGLMSQLQIMPTSMQLAISCELLMTNKAMPHEVAVMMLLHSNRAIRQGMIKMFMQHVSKKVFTALDLRRLIVLRNWLPVNERTEIDHLIKEIRLQKISPLPYPMSKLDSLVASPFDGAGAQLILFQIKQKNQRIIGGFIVKCGVGIREPWVTIKAVKGEFESICERCEMDFKPVTLAYVNKAVKHFIAEGHHFNNVPSPFLLQIAEILGATEWQAQSSIIQEELQRLRQKIDFDLSYHDEIKKSFNRSAQWDHTELFFHNWFECGELAEKSFENAAIKHQQLSQKRNNVEMEAIVMDEMIKPALPKWKTIILFMCLWARSKVIKEPLWKDLMILLDQLETEQTALTEIPVMQKIARQSAAAIIAKHYS